MTTEHCPKTLKFKLLVLGFVFLCVARFFTKCQLDRISCHSMSVRLFLHWLDLDAINSYEYISVVFNPSYHKYKFSALSLVSSPAKWYSIIATLERTTKGLQVHI